MPPKKKEEPKERPVLGRFRSNLKARQSCPDAHNHMSHMLLPLASSTVLTAYVLPVVPPQAMLPS